MPNIVCWDAAMFTLEQAMQEKCFSRMGSSIGGSSSTYTMDCLEAAEAAANAFSNTLGLAIANGDFYIDLSDGNTMCKFWELSFDCPSEVFDRDEWQDIIKVIS